MKKLSFLLFFMSCAFLQAQIVTIPDANFKNALVNEFCVDTDNDGFPDSVADTNNDGEIQVSEAEAVLGLFVSSYNIASLEGIESFVNLVELWCASNNLTALDLSQNVNLEWLTCGANQLTTLDLTANQNLWRVNCAANNLTSLITQNPNLIEIYCWMNQLTSLDVSQNPSLVVLSCRDNQLTELYLNNGNNVSLTTMLAYNNPNLFCIQVDDETVTPPTCDIDNNTGWCIDDWANYSEACIFDVDEFNTSAIAIYPNPAADFLNINSQNPIDSIKVYAINGSLVKDEIGNSQIDVSQLQSGLYMIRVTVDGATFIKKFIKS